jgi:hypothetical protein
VGAAAIYSFFFDFFGSAAAFGTAGFVLLSDFDSAGLDALLADVASLLAAALYPSLR